jgi:serine protease Do
MKLSHRVILVCLASHLLVSKQVSQDRRSPLLNLDQVSESIESVASRVTPSVVRISVIGYDFRSGSSGIDYPAGRKESIGSGIIVDPTGYIMTNAHVVESARQIMVSRVGAQRSISDAVAESVAAPMPARVVGVFKESDLALIKVEASNLPALSFADYIHLRQGQVVFAVGSPEGLQNSISMGIVSSVARQPDLDSPFLISKLILRSTRVIVAGRS